IRGIKGICNLGRRAKEEPALVGAAVVVAGLNDRKVVIVKDRLGDLVGWPEVFKNRSDRSMALRCAAVGSSPTILPFLTNRIERESTIVGSSWAALVICRHVPVAETMISP